LFTKTELNHLNFTGETLRFSNIPTWLLRIPAVDLTLLYFVHQTRSVFIAPVFVSHLHNMYDQFVKVYTDGSKTLTKAGCGIYVADKNLKYSIAINHFSNSFTSERFAILQALYLIYSLKIVRAVIVTGSLTLPHCNPSQFGNGNNIISQIKLSFSFQPFRSQVTRSSSFGYLLIKIFQKTNWQTSWQNVPQQKLQLKHQTLHDVL